MIFIVSLSSSCKKDESGDQNKPFIIMNPTNPLYWAKDLPYADPGAEAFDITESGDTVDISSSLQVTDNVNVSDTGRYNVYYNVSDAAGNQADQKIRDVIVVFGN